MTGRPDPDDRWAEAERELRHGPACTVCGYLDPCVEHRAEAAAEGVYPVAHLRDRNEPCQRGTVGCSVDHWNGDGSCETW